MKGLAVIVLCALVSSTAAFDIVKIGKKGFAVAAGAALVLASEVQAGKRMVQWGVDSRWASKVGPNNQLKFYGHWQDDRVSALDNIGIPFIPMCWGYKYYGKFNDQVKRWQASGRIPRFIAAFNEPDVPSQANMNPWEAAEQYRRMLLPHRGPNTRIISPAIAWDFQWMDKFMKAVGPSNVDYVAIHWYGKHTNIEGFKAYVNEAARRYGKKLFITEIGTTSAGGGDQWQTLDFLKKASAFLDAHPRVVTYVWTGAYAVTSPPDGFINRQTAMFTSSGNLRAAGEFFFHQPSYGRRRRRLSSSHRHVNRIKEVPEEHEADADGDEVPTELEEPQEDSVSIEARADNDDPAALFREHIADLRNEQMKNIAEGRFPDYTAPAHDDDDDDRFEDL